MPPNSLYLQGDSESINLGFFSSPRGFLIAARITVSGIPCHFGPIHQKRPGYLKVPVLRPHSLDILI